MAKKIDLGIEISAEMYNSIKDRDVYGDCYTFQQSNENVVGAPPHLSSPSPSDSVSESKARENIVAFDNNGSKPKKFVQRKVTPQDYIISTWIGVNNQKIGEKVIRMNAYISLMGEYDKKYTMFYTSKLTTAHDEIRRGLIKHDNKPLMTVFEDFIKEHGRDCMIGRLRLNPRKYMITDEHRYNHKHALLCVYTGDTGLNATLHLYDEQYEIELTKDTLLGEQGKFYDAAGVYDRDFGDRD